MNFFSEMTSHKLTVDFKKKSYPWGVAIPDQAALSVLAYCKSTKIKNMEIKSLPKSVEYSGFTGFEKAYDTIKNLSDDSMQYQLPVINMIKAKILPAILFYQYLHEKNYDEVTKTEFTRHSNIPICWFESMNIQKKISLEFHGKYGFELGVDLSSVNGRLKVQEKIQSDFREGIDFLRRSLAFSDGRCFYGDNVSIADCFIFSLV